MIIIKQLADKGKFECLGENTEKYKSLFVLIKKQVTKIDTEGNENIITVSYKIKIY